MAAVHQWVDQRASAIRVILAGPLALLTSLAVLAAMPVWFPSGAAGVDHLILPMILFPGLWGILFFYSVLSNNLIHIGIALVIIALTNSAAAIAAALGML